jgi:hypothetical protein
MKVDYVIRKYDGDDRQSYAVFYGSDISGLDKQIFYGQATPIASGLSRIEAIHHKKKLIERRNNER